MNISQANSLAEPLLHSPYPTPNYAAAIWTKGDVLCLGLPPSEGHSCGNTIELPATPNGLLAALKILRSREALRKPLTIGNPGVPTQALAEALARTTVRPHRETLSKDLDLALAELEL